MTSSNGNIFRVTGPLCGEFTGHRWIPLTKASDVELWCFLWSAPRINGWVNNREAGDLRRHHAHNDVIVMWKGWAKPEKIKKTQTIKRTHVNHLDLNSRGLLSNRVYLNHCRGINRLNKHIRAKRGELLMSALIDAWGWMSNCNIYWIMNIPSYLFKDPSPSLSSSKAILNFTTCYFLSDPVQYFLEDRNMWFHFLCITNLNFLPFIVMLTPCWIRKWVSLR